MKILMGSRSSSKGELRVWEKPREGEQYIIGCDPSLGRGTKAAADRSSICVMRRAPIKRLIQVADFTCKWRASDVGYAIAALGQWYNWAIINIERNYSDTPRFTLEQSGYPLEHFFIPVHERNPAKGLEVSYFTNKHGATQDHILDTFEEYLARDAMELRSAPLLAELRKLTKDERGKVATGGKDRAIAAMMAVMADQGTACDYTPQTVTEYVEEKCPPGIDNHLWKMRLEQARGPVTEIAVPPGFKRY